MYHKLLQDARLYDFLLQIDVELAVAARQAGCRCGGRLHSARYRRKPRGGPSDLGLETERRASFCCSREGCRKRMTPVSVRFLGRRVYWAAVVVLGSAMMQGVTPRRAADLRELLGVSVRTLKRWRHWWQKAFVETAFWRSMRAHFSPPPDRDTLPASLLERFSVDNTRSKLVATLRFLSPLSTCSSGSGAGMTPGR